MPPPPSRSDPGALLRLDNSASGISGTPIRLSTTSPVTVDGGSLIFLPNINTTATAETFGNLTLAGNWVISNNTTPAASAKPRR